MKKIFNYLVASIAGLSAFMLPNLAWAEYPDRPITIVVPYGPGGAADLSARLIAGSAPHI